jgi:hypothetical protein
MNIPDIKELEYFLDTHYVMPAADSPCGKAGPGSVKQGGLPSQSRKGRVTDYSSKELPQTGNNNNPNIKQAGIQVDEQAQRRAKTLVSFVGLSSSNAGGRFS